MRRKGSGVKGKSEIQSIPLSSLLVEDGEKRREEEGEDGVKSGARERGRRRERQTDRQRLTESERERSVRRRRRDGEIAGKEGSRKEDVE